jgi:hypothetical protein
MVGGVGLEFSGRGRKLGAQDGHRPERTGEMGLALALAAGSYLAIT